MTSKRRSSVRRVGLSLGLLFGLACLFPLLAQQPPNPRSPAGSADPRDGLMVLYEFRGDTKRFIEDQSGTGQPLLLKLDILKDVERAKDHWKVRKDLLLKTTSPAQKLTEGVRRSGELTIEAWIRPANRTQNGPARVISLSDGPNRRNFTLGQDGDSWEVRFRTSETNENGIPSLRSKKGAVITKNWSHLVYTRNRQGDARLYLNGKLNAQRSVKGNTLNWDRSFHLLLAGEEKSKRSWHGDYRLVALYRRALSADEVKRNFDLGSQKQMTTLARKTPSTDARLFEKQIAPLLAKRCLECHDSVTKQGGLDLSQKVAALRGGDNGPVLQAKSFEESSLWQAIESDWMPLDRDPLSKDEKQFLKEWLVSGAAWTKEIIDPADYLHDQEEAERWVQRLTRPEYIETVRSAVGVDITEEAIALLPPDIRADGFRNTAYSLSVDLKHVQAYAQLAAKIVKQMDVPRFARRFSKQSDLRDETMKELIREMGKHLFRGPLEEREVETFLRIPHLVKQQRGDFDLAVSFLLEAMLQSPRFIYRMEYQIGDGTTWRVSDYELASRLSYIIWGGPPDETLLQAAESGKLHDLAILNTQVKRMLQDPRAVNRSLQFLSEWLNLDRLDHLRPNSEHFPRWNAELAADMKAETLAFFREVAWEQKRPLSDLLNAQLTYLTPELAVHYGLSPQAESLAMYPLNEVPARGGLLTQGSILTIGGDEASMVTRGLFVLQDLLRGTVQDPPPCVDTTPVASKAGLTQRGIAEERIANPSCGGCHVKFEPLAFGLEKFDGLGGYHETDEYGNPLREDGELLFPGTAEPISYETAAELMDLLAESERVRECITWKVAQFALGRPLVAADTPLLQQIHRTSQQQGGTYAEVITAIVMSDLVLKTRTEKQP
ncbi:Planctomycete cytochrome C [Planctomycetales bacterium 10988]|nr:Planctomycete cytochrome C [Planctomycetales bacterium 10988]